MMALALSGSSSNSVISVRTSAYPRCLNSLTNVVCSRMRCSEKACCILYVQSSRLDTWSQVAKMKDRQLHLDLRRLDP